MTKKSLLRPKTLLRYPPETTSRVSDSAANITSFPTQKSLLYRASKVKEHALVPYSVGFSNPKQPIQGSGIDDKDIQEIQAHIKDLWYKNRIILDSKDFQVSSTKNALAFPLLVNSLMVGIAIGVLLLVGQVVTGDRAQSNYDQAFSSVEGQLIQQMRQDLDFRLGQKEQEIEAIRKQLAFIKIEERNTAHKFEDLYRQREREVQDSLEQDLASERNRLITTEVPEENIESLLAAYKQDRLVYYHVELGKYQAQLEAEQEAAQGNYQQLKDKYQQDLKNLNNERRIIQETVRQNENQRRLGREQSTASQASPDPERSAGLGEAQARLAVLEEQQQEILLREKRLIGMYREIRTTLEQRRYSDALGQAESLIQYLETNPQESLSPQERSLDRYFAEVLARIARTELTRSQDQGTETTEQEVQIARLTQVNQELSQALSDQDRTRITERTGLETRIVFLEQDNARLTQSNRELSQALAARSTGEAATKELETQVVVLKQNNARLTQSNQELSQALAARSSGDAGTRELETRVVVLEQNNARLTQSNQELSQALADRSTEEAPTRELETQVAVLKQDNARLTQSNQELSQALAVRSSGEAAIRELETQVAVLKQDNARLTQSNQELSQALADQSSKAGLENSKQVAAFEEANQRLNQRIEEQMNALALADRAADDLKEQVQDAYREGVTHASGIIETALRIPQQDTRTKYLENIRERYRLDAPIIDLIDMLLRRF
ncbi:MAG: hypothetical protein LBL76_08990 [Treponema sp.]|jgi:hypothetical protein|nr:hypothetical protein [Treponema sp.]